MLSGTADEDAAVDLMRGGGDDAAGDRAQGGGPAAILQQGRFVALRGIGPGVDPACGQRRAGRSAW
jgi:hypothetical protein